MIAAGLVRTIKAAADTFDERDIAQGFVTTLCCVFNGYCESLYLQMRMIMINKPRQKDWRGSLPAWWSVRSLLRGEYDLPLHAASPGDREMFVATAHVGGGNVPRG